MVEWPGSKSGPVKTNTLPSARVANFLTSDSTLLQILRLLVGSCGTMFDSAKDWAMALGLGASAAGD
ncbi:hypothetical protein D3C73_1533000 [compost metagenome]